MRRTRVAGSLLVAAALAGATACTGSDGTAPQTAAEATTLTVAFGPSAEHPQAAALTTFGTGVSEATDGRIAVSVQTDQTMGDAATALRGVADGTIDLAVVSGPTLEPFNEDFGLFDLPYVFASPDAQAAALADRAVTEALFPTLEESRNITVLGGMYGGTRNVYTIDAPVRGPADLAGRTIRVPSSQAAVAMIEAMGGVAVPMALKDVRPGLGNGTVDGAENTVLTYTEQGHLDAAPQYSATAHLMIPDYLVINTDRLASLSDGDRQVLLEAVPGLIGQANSTMLDAEGAARATAEEGGATFVDDVDVQAFADLTRPQVEDSLTNEVRVRLYEAVQRANEAHP
ncbi:MAG: TRAP transporter substrate-binding protein DctP [Propioniciclava sp.]